MAETLKPVSREQLLKPAERRIKTLTYRPFGEIRIRSLLESEMRTLRESMQDKKGELIRARSAKLNLYLVAACLVNESGDRLLNDEDVRNGAMDQMDGQLVSVLVKECKEWTGFGNDSDWQAIEDAAKNSESTSSN